MAVKKVLRPNFEKGNGLIDAVLVDLNGHILFVSKLVEAQWREILETGRMFDGSIRRPIAVGMTIDCDGDAVVCTVASSQSDVWSDDLKPNFHASQNGLVPVVAQDAGNFDILMLAYTNAAGLQETVDRKVAVYYSRSRGGRWAKGETSNNWQDVSEVFYSKESNALIYKVHQRGPGACHLNARSCFFRSVLADQPFLMSVPLELGPGDMLKTIDLPVHQNLIPSALRP